jgi:antitoxin component YwqK of YwqJK toxin-antitoxin module
MKQLDYLNGSKQGITREYYESGRLKEIVLYLNGMLIARNQYSETGNLLLKESFDNGGNILVRNSYETEVTPLKEEEIPPKEEAPADNEQTPEEENNQTE